MKRLICSAVVVGMITLCIGAYGQAVAGSLAAWGDNFEDQCNVPAGNDFVQAACGHEHSLALKSDGSLVAWGYNDYGQCDVPFGKDFIQVACGFEHSLALKSDGSLAAWGWNYFGQCDVPDGNDFIQVACGYEHSLALKSDGSLAAWGWNYFGQCDVPDGNDFIQVASGLVHSLALKSDGSLIAWGCNDYGQCDVPSGNDFIQVACGYEHSLALKSDGSLITWGQNDDGQCEVPAGNNFIQAAGGWQHSLALRSDGSLAAWGSNTFDQCDAPAGNDFVRIAVGAYHNLALISTVKTVIHVPIDIKPGDSPNCINNNGHGVIPVAILGSADFDVTQIDPATVQMEGLSIKTTGKRNKLLAHIADVNNDGFKDLMFQIEDRKGAFTEGSSLATVTGTLLDGTSFEGADEICLVPKKLGKEPASFTSTETPESCALLSNYPNPFNPETTITYQLPEQSHVILEIYNISGEKVDTLVNRVNYPGHHAVTWNGRDNSGQPVTGGIYLCRMQAGTFHQMIRMILLK
jgi:hypothetical protein